jgi:hypothetical protein
MNDKKPQLLVFYMLATASILLIGIGLLFCFDLFCFGIAMGSMALVAFLVESLPPPGAERKRGIQEVQGDTLISRHVAWVFFLAVAAVVLIPFILRRNATGHLTPCRSSVKTGAPVCSGNLESLHIALDLYYNHNSGFYPPALSDLPPRYLKALPTCPAAKKMTYAYKIAARPDRYTLWCRGSWHKQEGPSGYPQYDSQEGLRYR